MVHVMSAPNGSNYIYFAFSNKLQLNCRADNKQNCCSLTA